MQCLPINRMLKAQRLGMQGWPLQLIKYLPHRAFPADARR
jgi:hypothetical protein